jgi:predicted nuclease of predicted toxin-antitoxin system
MKLLLDQGLPRSTAALMTAGGIDTVHVGDVGLAAASDVAILRFGLETGRTIVTLDADFNSLLAMSGAAAPSVIRIRIEGLRAAGLAELLQSVIPECIADLTFGATVTVQRGRIRIRHLPLVRE